MKINIKLKFAVAVLALFAGLFYGASANAGFGVSPISVQSKFLLPGSVYEQQFSLSRSVENEAWNVTANISGDTVKDWITMDRGTSFDMPVGEKVSVAKVLVRVPADAKVGDYFGSISFVVEPIISASANAAQAGGVRNLSGVMVDINVSVTDQHVSKFQISQITGANVETGSPLKFLIGIDNTGNIPAAPTAGYVKLMKFNEDTALETLAITEFSSVDPFRSSVIPVFTDKPTAVAPGLYRAKVSLYSGEKLAHESAMTLNVYASGAMNKGEISAFYLERQTVKVGDRTESVAVYQNTGTETVSAKFFLEVYFNGIKIDSIQSDWKNVGPQTPTEFRVNFTPDKKGSYVLKGYFDHDGVKTDPKEIQLNVNYSDYNVKLLMISGAAAAVLCALITFLVVRGLFKRKKSSKKSKK
jgi:hypothetical protein